MKISNNHADWHNMLNTNSNNIIETLEISYNIIQEILDENEDKLKEEGVLHEHNQVKELINNLKSQEDYELNSVENILITRYIETAYTVYNLYFKCNRKDLVLKNIKQWFHGMDFNGGSNFRNFEFECSVALRFIEEDITIDDIDAEGSPDYLIEDKFAIECKRTTVFFGVLSNIIKARKQADNFKKPTIVIINLDYIYNEQEGVKDIISSEELLKICSIISEYGLGIERSYLIGVVLDVLDNNDNSLGSKLVAIKNINTELSQIEEIWKKVSLAMCGDETLLFYEKTIDINNRFDEKEIISKEKFYNDIIVNNIQETIFTNHEKRSLIIDCIKNKD
ncbi:hypothetical protein HGQ85_18540 [Clostridioides difficile]|nr:hypothetical protein [Clostridioides difficile]